MEIRLADVEATVEIAIRTLYSRYIFRITEPQAGRGFLSGGRLGTKPRGAFLANTFLGTNRCISKKDRLATGYKAMFYLDGTGPEIITTSVITELECAVTQRASISREEC